MTEQKFTVNREKREILYTRVFDAPHDVVYRAYSDPDLVPQWWGTADTPTTVDRMDVRVGGTWRYIQHAPDGNKFAFNGVYREVVPGEKLVYTFNFELMPGHDSLETVLFEDHGGKTLLSDSGVYQTLEDLDGTLDVGGEQGSIDLWDRLADVIKKLQTKEK